MTYVRKYLRKWMNIATNAMQSSTTKAAMADTEAMRSATSINMRERERGGRETDRQTDRQTENYMYWTEQLCSTPYSIHTLVFQEVYGYHRPAREYLHSRKICSVC